MIFCVAHNENIWHVNARIYLSPEINVRYMWMIVRNGNSKCIVRLAELGKHKSRLHSNISAHMSDIFVCKLKRLTLMYVLKAVDHLHIF